MRYKALEVCNVLQLKERKKEREREREKERDKESERKRGGRIHYLLARINNHISIINYTLLL